MLQLRRKLSTYANSHIYNKAINKIKNKEFPYANTRNLTCSCMQKPFSQPHLLTKIAI